MRGHRRPGRIEDVVDRTRPGHPPQPRVARRVAAPGLGLPPEQRHTRARTRSRPIAYGSCSRRTSLDDRPQSLGRDPPAGRSRPAPPAARPAAAPRRTARVDHRRHPGVVLEPRHLRRVDRAYRHLGDQVVDGGLGRPPPRRAPAAPPRCSAGRRGSAPRPARRTDAAAPGGGRAGTPPGAARPRSSRCRRALDADRLREVGADQLVLLRLNGRDDVPHRSDPGPLDLGGQDPARGAELLAAAEVLVLEAGERAAREPEPSPHRHPLRVGDAGAVEGARHRRPPVQHHRFAGLVGHVPAPDVVHLAAGGAAVEPELAEEQRHVRVVGQLGRPVAPAPCRATRRPTRRRPPRPRWRTGSPPAPASGRSAARDAARCARSRSSSSSGLRPSSSGLRSMMDRAHTPPSADRS